MLEAMLRELDMTKDYLAGEPLQSVYFGGGTPSLLTVPEINRLFTAIRAFHHILPDAEITLEANPDDLSMDKLHALREQTPVNRLSIGIQSFFEEDLRWMNRAHSGEEAAAVLERALTAGFSDLSVDLIYGAPTTTDERWAENVRRVLDFKVPHISGYNLTVEEGTALGVWVKRGQTAPMDDEQAIRQFDYLMDATAAAGYEHYEISNFALPGRYARHNSSYWLGAHYLGIGPSAHSFNGSARRWNLANNALYIKSLEAGILAGESELLSPEQRYHEYVMTGIRTIWGVDPDVCRQIDPSFGDWFLARIQPLEKQGFVEKRGNAYGLTRAGKKVADQVTVALFR